MKPRRHKDTEKIASTSYLHLIDHHQDEQGRQIKDGNSEKPMRMRVRSEKSDGESIAEINEPEQDCTQQINRSRKPKECRQHAYWDKRAAVKHDLSAGLFAARMYREARSSVVFGEDPRDGEKVRHLPQKQDCEKRQGYSVDFAPCRRPSHQRRSSAGKCSD